MKVYALSTLSQSSADHVLDDHSVDDPLFSESFQRIATQDLSLDFKLPFFISDAQEPELAILPVSQSSDTDKSTKKRPRSFSLTKLWARLKRT